MKRARTLVEAGYELRLDQERPAQQLLDDSLNQTKAPDDCVRSESNAREKKLVGA